MAIRKRGKSWIIDYYYNGSRIRETVGESKKLAEKVLSIRKASIAQGKFNIQDTKPSMTFEELSKIYIEYARANKKSWKRDIVSLNNLLPFFENMRLKDISPLLIEQYKQERIKHVAPSTANKELAVGKHMLNLGIKWGKTNKNPFRDVKLFREKNRRLRFLSEEEIHKLIRNCSKQLRPVVIVALSTGMRRSEILGLKWDDIDFKNNLIILTDTKSGYSREIKIDDDLRRYLLDLKSKSSHDFIFLSRLEKPYKDVKTTFKTALRKANLKDVNLTTLRHTFAAHHAMQGTPIPTLMKLMGHRTINMTMRYAHLSPSHMQQRVNIFQRRLRIIDGHKMVTSTKIEKEYKTVKP